MKKNQTVQGTFSKLFGKKHANPATTSLYATNPPWIFTQEAPEEGTRDFDGIYYGDSRFNTVSESGTATLKARPRVRPLLTFLPLNAQENHGLAVPTPSVPEDFVDKEVTGTGSLVNGNLRLYSSVGDLRPEHYGLDPLIPPPPPGPAPGPPQDISQSPEEAPPLPPPFTAPLSPPLLLESPPPPPPNMAPPPPPILDTLSPLSALSPPPTPTPPDFIPPAPPLAFLAPPPPSLPAPAPPVPMSPPSMGTCLFAPGGVTKWKSEVALNGKQPEAPRTSPPRSPAKLKGSPLAPNSEPHLTFPRAYKVPPPTPVRTSSIPVQEAQGAPPEEEGATKKAPSRFPLPPSFHIRPASQVYPDRVPASDYPRELRSEAPDSPRLSQSTTKEQAGTPPPAPPLPPPAPPLPPPAPPLPPAASPLPSAEQAAPPPVRFTKSPKSSSPALKPKPTPPIQEDTPSSGPVDWRDPSQMEKLRSELAAYLCGSRREDRSLNHRSGPMVASQDKESKEGPSQLEEAASTSLPEKIPPGVPEKSPCSSSLPLPPVDYIPQEVPTSSVQQIRNELEARLSAAAQKEAKPSIASLPPKPRLEGGRIFENGTDNGKLSRPVPRDPPALSTPLPTTSPKATPGSTTPPKATPGSATPPNATPGPATPPKATPGPGIPSTATALPISSSHLMAKKDLISDKQQKPESPKDTVSSQPGTAEATRLPTQGALPSPDLPPKTSPSPEEVPFLYKPHHSQNSPSREVAVVMPTLARGEAAGSARPAEVKEPPVLPVSTPTPAHSADQLLRHPVTGEVVEQGTPMALLLAARQRALKARLGGTALGRSLPGSLRGHRGVPEASSDSIFYSDGRPNSFTVVPKSPKQAEKDSQPTSTARPSAPSPWKPQRGRDPGGTEPIHRPKWTKAELPAFVARERPPLNLLRLKSSSSPPSPSYKREGEEEEGEDEEEEEFSFEVIPPPPEFSNDPEPPVPPLQYVGRRGSPPRNSFSDLVQPLDAPTPGFSRFSGARYPGAGGRSLIKKRLYVGEPHRNPALPRGAPGCSLSSPNCFGPQPGGPDMRRVNSAGRATLGGLQARRLSLEGAARGAAEAKYKAPGGGGAADYGYVPATGRSPRYGSPINTFTVRPGTRHPISYAYSGAHRKAAS